MLMLSTCAMQHQRRADDAKKAGQLERAMALYKKVAEMWPTAGTFLDCAQCAEIQNDHVAVVSLPHHSPDVKAHLVHLQRA